MRNSTKDFKGGEFLKIVDRLNQDLPKALLNFEIADRHLGLVRAIHDQTPSDQRDLTVAQFSISNMVGNGVDQVKFLPIETQLKGLEIEYGLKKSELEQIDFRLKLARHILERLNQALILVLNDKTAETFPVQLVDHQFWTKAGNENFGELEKSNLRKQYTENDIDAIIKQLENASDRYNLIKSTSYLISSKLSFSQAFAMMAGLLLGLVAVLIVFLVENIGSALSTAQSKQNYKF